MPVVVERYNPEWATQFSEIRGELEQLLSEVEYISIEHVGSTSVPGLPAKPILDIDVVVTQDQLESVITALQHDGVYIYMGELGIPDLHAFRAPLKTPTINMYVCIEGLAPLRNHIAVRDLLRSDEKLRKEYGELKFNLGSSGMEIHEYMSRKHEMVLRLVEISGALSRTEIEKLKMNNQPGSRVRPVKTKNFLLREFVIGDLKALYDVYSGEQKMSQIQDTIVKIIQNGGKSPRDHLELAVLHTQGQDEAKHRLVGRIGARTLRPSDTPTNQTNLSSTTQGKVFRVTLHVSLQGGFYQGWSIKEILEAFIQTLIPLSEKECKDLLMQIKCQESDKTISEIVQQLDFAKLSIKEGDREVYERSIKRPK